MNILYYGRGRFKNLGGGSVHVNEVFSNLSRLGHNIVSLDGEHLWGRQETNTNLHLSLWKRLKKGLLALKTFLLFSGGSHLRWAFLCEILLFLLGFYRIIRQKPKFDMIYRRHNLFDSEYFLAKLFGIPLIKEVNGIIVDEVKVGGYKNKILLWILDRIERFSVPKADKIIVVTSKLKEVLSHDYGVSEDKIVVIQNGTNIELFQPMDTLRARRELNLEQAHSYICFVGTLEHSQGIEHLIKAAPLILKKIPSAEFLIVGDGPLRKELLSLVEQTGISSDKVEFIGMVPYHKVPLYINASDVCVAPFIKARNERIGLSPLKFCEYTACEKPIVASRVSGLEILEQNDAGILVEPGNPEELAKAIARLLTKEELRQQMGKNGRRYVVENRTWESVAKKVAGVCESVVSSKNKSRQ